MSLPQRTHREHNIALPHYCDTCLLYILQQSNISLNRTDIDSVEAISWRVCEQSVS
jgi:hypothetical protein